MRSARELLAPSLAAARLQRQDNPEEKIFHIKDRVFLGTRFGAADRALLDGLQIGAVVNLTAGATRVPNYFEGDGIEYLHLELMDELVTNPSQAVPQGCRAVQRWSLGQVNVLVHCQLGLSRSAIVVLAWLMRHAGLSLKSATDLLMERRGRRPRCNPSFWCYIASLERELCGWRPGTEPSFNFLPWLVEDLSDMGLKYPPARIAEAIRDEADWVEFMPFYKALCGSGFKRLMAAQCVAQSAAPEARMSRRAAEAASELGEVYHAWPAMQAFCLRILSPLVGSVGKEMGEYVASLGSIGKAVAAMRAHPSDPDVQEAGCGLMAFLAACSPHLAKEVLLLGGVVGVVSALQTHRAVPQVQATGCAALLCLGAVRGPQSKSSEAAGASAAEAVMMGMQACPAAEKVQELGSAVLTGLASRGLVGGHCLPGAAGAVRSALRAFPAAAAVQERGRAALQAIGASEETGSTAHGPAFAMESPKQEQIEEGPGRLRGA